MRRVNLFPAYPYKTLKYQIMYTAVLASSQLSHPAVTRLSETARRNAEKVLDYLADINLEIEIRFRPTSADSLLIAWRIEEWEFEIECLKNGYLVYSFIKNDYQEGSGCERFDDFIPQFEKYLLKL